MPLHPICRGGYRIWHFHHYHFILISTDYNWLCISYCQFRFQRFKSLLLVLLSLVFYAWGDMKNVPILLISIVFNFATGHEIYGLLQNKKERQARIAMFIGAVVNVLLLGVFKYTGLTQPVGVSFYTFSALSYLFDIYRGRIDGPSDLITDALYMTFFPKLISGPIVQYKDMKEQILSRTVSRPMFWQGSHLFLIGLFKKVLLADQLGVAFNQIYSLSSMSVLSTWLGMIFYSLQLYFDFSGYSDMAIGLANMFGFEVQKNFDYPYTATGPSDFWRRWHISLGAWFRDYVYIPLGGNRGSQRMQMRNLTIVWLLTGIWHGNTLNYVFWGIWHGAFVLMEKFLWKDNWKKLPEIARILIMDLIAFVGWVFFFNPSLSSSLTWIVRLFGIGASGFIDGTSLYYLFSHLILLIVSIIGCTSIVSQIHDRFVYRQGRFLPISIAVFAILFIFTLANMVGSTYSTFMYFQF